MGNEGKSEVKEISIIFLYWNNASFLLFHEQGKKMQAFLNFADLLSVKPWLD